jgi:hypothetical protein
MTELLLAVALVSAAALGLGAGLVLGGRPPRASCGGDACKGRCATCPHRAGPGG